MEEQLQNTVESTSVNLALSQAAMENLRNTAKWMNFLSIMGFIGCGFMVLAGLIMLISGGVLGGIYGAGMGVGMFFVYIIMAVVMLFPSIFLSIMPRI